jgi:type II secretory pathway component GspD/PulD (secretin)
VPWRDALDLVAEKVGAIVETASGRDPGVLSPHKVTSSRTSPQDVREVIEDDREGAGAQRRDRARGRRHRRRALRGRAPGAKRSTSRRSASGFVVVEEGHGVPARRRAAEARGTARDADVPAALPAPEEPYKPVIKSEFISVDGRAKAAGGAGTDATKGFSALAALSKALSIKGQLDYIDTANVVIVRDTQQVHQSIRSMLTRLDVEPAQVFCDVKFVSRWTATCSTWRRLRPGRGAGHGRGGSIPITLPFNEGSGGWEDLFIASPNGDGPFVNPDLNGGATFVPDTIFGSLSFAKFQARCASCSATKSAEVIQAPKLIALDGQEATIFVGETIRYAEAKSEQGQAGGLQLTIAEAAGSPVEIGFQLLVRPNVVPAPTGS